MSVRRGVAAVLLLAAFALAVLALVRLVDNPDVPGRAWDDDGTYQCLAPWDTVLNGADNTPGGEPPPDAEVIATRCRHAGYASVDDAYVAGSTAVGLLAVALALGATRRRTAVASVVAATVAATAVAGLGWAGWERRHPTAFEDSGAGMSFDLAPRKGVYFGVSWPGHPGSDVVIETARPMVTEDTAHGSFEAVVCVPRKGADPINSVSADDIDDYCAQVVPLNWDTPDVRLRSARKDQLLVEVTTNAPGTVKVSGVEVVYRDGWQRGRQEVVADVSATTPKTAKR